MIEPAELHPRLISMSGYCLPFRNSTYQEISLMGRISQEQRLAGLTAVPGKITKKVILEIISKYLIGKGATD